MESYTIVCKNRSFGRLVRFSYETVQDAKKMGNILMATVGTWGAEYPRTKELFYSKFFTKGYFTAGHDVFDNSITGVVSDPSGNKIYDGQTFFAAAHPDKVGGTYSNVSASATLTVDNLKTIYNTFTITNNRNERGEIIDLMPDTILIHPALRFTAQEILNSSLIPDSVDNTINVLASIVQPIVWPYLAGSDDWYLLKRKMGLMATEREDVSIDFWQDEVNLSYYARIFCRFGGVVSNWRGAYGANLPTS